MKNRSYTILSKLADRDVGLIKVLGVLITHSSGQYPGVSVDQFVRLDVKDRIPSTTSDQELINYVKTLNLLDDPFNNQFVAEQLSMAFDQSRYEELVSPPITTEDVNIERDRRISEGFMFQGKMYDFDPASKQRIAGAASAAGLAVANGASEGDWFWHGGQTPFAWIAKDNSINPMDAITCLDFGQTALRHDAYYIFKARLIKDMDPIPMDFRNDEYWL